MHDILSINKLKLKADRLENMKFEFPTITTDKMVSKILKEKESLIRKELHDNYNLSNYINSMTYNFNSANEFNKINKTLNLTTSVNADKYN